MLKIIKESKKSDILVITPLFTGHQISSDTRTTIKRNGIDYTWVSYESNLKHAANVQKCLEEYELKYLSKPYIFVLDRDIILGRHILDKLYLTLSKSPEPVAFSYCSFEYKGHINIKFEPQGYNINKLLRQNYISSNSLYKTDVIKKVRGFITDEDTHRLSDWAMFLKLFYNGYIGKLSPDASFTAISTEKDISAGSNEEYFITRNIVIERYIKPVLEKIKNP